MNNQYRIYLGNYVFCTHEGRPKRFTDEFCKEGWEPYKVTMAFDVATSAQINKTPVQQLDYVLENPWE